MMSILIAIGAVILVVYGLGCLFWRADWSDSCKADRPKITFEQFESYYNVAPEKWELFAYRVDYHFNEYYSKAIDFKTFKDYKKYYAWRSEYLSKERENTRVKAEMEILQDIEKDIKKLVEKEVKKDENS